MGITLIFYLYRLINSVCAEYDNLSESMLDYLINTLSYYGITNENFMERLCGDIKSDKLLVNTREFASDILYLLAKCRYADFEALDKIVDTLMIDSADVEFIYQVRDFWGLSVLLYHEHNNEFVGVFERRCLNLDDKDRITDTAATQTLLAYSLIYGKWKDTEKEINYDVMKLLIKQVLKSMPRLDYHSINVTLQSLARLNIRNEKVFEEAANRLMKDIQNMDEVPIKPKEISQIFSAY